MKDFIIRKFAWTKGFQVGPYRFTVAKVEIEADADENLARRLLGFHEEVEVEGSEDD